MVAVKVVWGNWKINVIVLHHVWIDVTIWCLHEWHVDSPARQKQLTAKKNQPQHVLVRTSTMQNKHRAMFLTSVNNGKRKGPRRRHGPLSRHIFKLITLLIFKKFVPHYGFARLRYTQIKSPHTHMLLKVIASMQKGANTDEEDGIVVREIGLSIVKIGVETRDDDDDAATGPRKRAMSK